LKSKLSIDLTEKQITSSYKNLYKLVSLNDLISSLNKEQNLYCDDTLFFISSEEKKSLNYIRKVRNKFIHYDPSNFLIEIVTIKHAILCTLKLAKKILSNRKSHFITSFNVEDSIIKINNLLELEFFQ